MESILLIIASILPIYILGKSIYSADKEKESLKLLIKLLISGIFACILVVIISINLGNYLPIFLKSTDNMNIIEFIVYSFICIALVEELCKLFMVYLTAYHNKEFDYTFDMIVYGVFTALGFAFFENILYIIEGGLPTAIARAFTAIPAHASNGVFMGIFLSKAKCFEVIDRNKCNKYKILAVLVPTLIHGIYDMCAFSNEILLLISFITTLFTVTIIYIINKQETDLKINEYHIE